MKMKKKIAVAVAAALSVAAFAKDASDGLVGWWRLEKGENGAVLQASDLRDHVHAGSTASAVNHATEDGKFPAYPICHTNMDLTYPVGCGVIENASCFYFSQPTNYNENGERFVNRQNIVFPASKIDVADKPCTFIIRMRITAPRVAKDSNGSPAFITVFSYDWHWGYNRGWRFGLRPEGSLNWSWFGVGIGNSIAHTTFGDTYAVSQNFTNNPNPNWYDIGVVIEPNVPESGKTRVIFYQGTTNALTRVNGNLVSGAGRVRVATQTVANVSGNLPLSERNITIGDSNGSSSWISPVSAASAFRGMIHEMKLYDRALSAQEFEHACAPYSDPLFTVGSKNGSTDEFSDDTAEDVYEPFEMPWWNLRKTLTSENPSLSIKTSLTAADLDVSRILEFTPFYSDGCPDNANIEVLLNGTVVAKVERNADADRLVHINGKTIARLVTLTDDEYPLTLTLKRVDGMAGSVSFDRISLGGGWQLGIRDDLYKDFRTWNNSTLYNFYRYYLARQNIKLFAGQMYGPDQNGGRSAKQTLCFSVSEALAAKGAFVLKTRPLADGTVEYYLNGEKFSTETVTILTDYEVEIPNGMLKGGINELMAYWITSAGKNSTGFDYIRLTPKRFPRGSIYLIR